MDELFRDFLTECYENLERIEHDLVDLEQSADDPELLRSIFRAMHTIKGTSGFFNLPRLESIAHSAENVLGLVRDEVLPPAPLLISDILDSVDKIRDILAALETSEVEPDGDDTDLKARLDRWCTGDVSDELFRADAVARSPKEEAVEESIDPLELEMAEGVEEDEGDLALDDLSEDEFQALFDAARKGTPNPVATPELGSSEDSAPLKAEPVESARVNLEVEGSSVASSPKEASGETVSKTRSQNRQSVIDNSLRVDVAILDRLMNLAGELVLTRNQLNQVLRATDNSSLGLPVQQLSRVTNDLQEVIMKARMQPIANAWSKFPRLIRDLSQETGKKVELEMIGQDTELDRQIIQAIADPLTHMIRNSIDHGIESPAQRRAAGKAETGRITLRAFHESGHILVEVSDDGAGLDRERILRKAIERGLVRSEDAVDLTDPRVFEFIFEAGFSTAAEVTNLSGRGVGMDVVRSNIERINGRIDIESVLGRGTTFRIKLPLTLAILPALIVGAASTAFAIPQVVVEELVQIREDAEMHVEEVTGSLFYRLRDTLLPLVRLADVLKLSYSPDETPRQFVVCQIGSFRFGLVVDAIYDTQEIVVKPVGSLVQDLPYYAGTTILGDGRVIMILDVSGIAGSVIDMGSVLRDEVEIALVEDEEALGSKISWLLLDSGRGVNIALPLERVSRLEKLPQTTIERVGEHWIVQYRDGLLPVFAATDSVDVRAIDPRPVVVVEVRGERFGLAVDAICDIVEDSVMLESGSSSPGLLGTAVIAGRSTEVVDETYFLSLARAGGFGQRRSALSANLDTQTSTEENDR